MGLAAEQMRRAVDYESLETRMMLSYPVTGNDNFADAARLAGTNATASAQISNATVEAGEPGLVPPQSSVPGVVISFPYTKHRTLWWKWTAPQEGAFTVDTAGSNCYAVVRVYTGNTLAALQPVPADQPNGGYFAHAGTTYRIVVDDNSPGTVVIGDIDGVVLHLVQTNANAPSSSGFVHTTPLTQPYVFSAEDFLREFTATGDRPLTRIILGRIYGQPWPGFLGLSWPGAPLNGLYYDGAPATPGTEISIADISRLVAYPTSMGSDFSFKFWAGDSVRYANRPSQAEVYIADAHPENDDYANRKVLSGTNVLVHGSTAGATSEPRELLSLPTVWYDWTAPFDADVALQFTGSAGAAVFEGCPFVSPAQYAPLSAVPGHMFHAIEGKTYSIVVYGNDGPADFDMSLRAHRAVTIAGTGGDDVISVNAVGDMLVVSNNGVTSSFARTEVSSISVRAGAGNDLVTIGTGVGDVFIRGGRGNDTIYSSDGDDTIAAGAGNDVVYAGGGKDWVAVGGGNDTIYGNLGADTLLGGNGDDLLRGGAGLDSIGGENGEDTLFGGGGDDILSGNDGNDLIDGGGGTDTIYGNAGNDIISGGGGDDDVRGGAGHDTLRGGLGNDLLFGGVGNDLVAGGEGDDRLIGGIGQDTLLGGAGTNSIFAQDGEMDFIDSPGIWAAQKDYNDLLWSTWEGPF